MKKVLLISCTALLLITACKTSDKREKFYKEILAEQELLFKDSNITLEKSQHLMDLYLAFAEDYPQDSMTPEFLFYCAGIAVNTQQEMYAITLYQRIYDEYPNHAIRPIALLNKALVYDNMGDAEHAKPLYEQFLVMFPDDPYVSDVEQLLEKVDLSPEEWILQMMENQENEDSNILP